MRIPDQQHEKPRAICWSALLARWEQRGPFKATQHLFAIRPARDVNHSICWRICRYADTDAANRNAVKAAAKVTGDEAPHECLFHRFRGRSAERMLHVLRASHLPDVPHAHHMK